MAMTRQVVVVGGGIGGVFAALALRSCDLDVTLVERSPEFGEVGAGLQLAPNATRVLEDWGLLDRVLQAGFTPERLVLRDALDGDVLTYQKLTGGFVERYGAPYVVIHRSDLHAIAVQETRDRGVTLVTSAEVESITDTDLGVEVRAADGRVWSAQACIAADGLTSRIRDSFVGDEPIASGYVAYRGTVPAAADDPLPDVVAWIGPGCHFVRYPLRHGEMINQVAVFRSPGFLAGRPDWGGVDELDAAFAACCSGVRQGVRQLWRDRRWPMFDRLPTTSWRRGSTLLTGDAAHPMLQYLAQGACQAIEDAAQLRGAVRGLGRTPEATDWPMIFDQVIAERQAKAARVQQTAREWGEIWHIDGIGRTLRNELMRHRDLTDYRYLDWLYG